MMSITPNSLQPPYAAFGDIDLLNTRLHYVKTGSGPPLVIVPATVSLIRQWLPLAQFMGQRFTTYFFELPGTWRLYALPGKVRKPPGALQRGSLCQRDGTRYLHLMGFSFGGLLALRTLEHLQDQGGKVILLSPVVSRQALEVVYAPAVDLQGLHQGAQEFLRVAGYSSSYEHAATGMAADLYAQQNQQRGPAYPGEQTCHPPAALNAGCVRVHDG